jgi:predicted dehydrogenase
VEDGQVTTSSRDALECVARNFWAAIYEGAALQPSCEEGLHVQELFDAVRTVDVERRWMLSEPVLGMGYR